MNKEIKSILKRWESSLIRFGKIDSWNFSQSLEALSGYVRSTSDDDVTRRQVREIRDRALVPTLNADYLVSLIQTVLGANSHEIELCDDTNGTSRTQKNGQDVRFRHETSRIFEERLRFKSGMLLRNFDIETEAACDAKIVRRIVEKRMCQAYHRIYGKNRKNRHSNSDRYWEHRATAFQLYNIGQVENVEVFERGKSTHWKKMYDYQTQQVVYKKKMAYSSIEEAEDASKKWKENHPYDSKEIHAYQCDFCHKWHIGHDSSARMNREVKLEVAC